MANLESRVTALEGKQIKNEEMIIQIGFVKPRGQDWTEEEKRRFSPVNEQIEAARAMGKRCFQVFENKVDYWDDKL